MVFWGLTGGNWLEESQLEGRFLSTFPVLSYRDFKTAVKRIFQRMPEEAGDIFFNQLLDKRYQQEFSKAVKEQFPGRTS